jgi:chemotaxis signal transduction protein
VLSLRRYLRAGGGQDPEGPDRGMLVVVTAPYTVALLVDAAAEVRRCAPGELQLTVGAAGDRAHAAIQAVTGDLLQVLDPGALLADPALVVGREAT